MGVGKGKYGLYGIGKSGVRLKGFRKNMGNLTADPQEQALWVRTINLAPLTFPCTLQALIDFVESRAGQVGGIHFTLPDGFREAAAEILAKSSTDQAERDIQDAVTSGECSTTGGLQIVSAGETAADDTVPPWAGEASALSVTAKEIAAAFPVTWADKWPERLKKAAGGKSYQWLTGTLVRRGSRKPGDANTYSPAAVAAALVLRGEIDPRRLRCCN
jgi:hypothetical protein